MKFLSIVLLIVAEMQIKLIEIILVAVTNYCSTSHHILLVYTFSLSYTSSFITV